MRVKSVPHLLRLVMERKAVTANHPAMNRRPAAFVANMSAQVVQGWIDRGLFIYKPKSKKA